MKEHQVHTQIKRKASIWPSHGSTQRLWVKFSTKSLCFKKKSKTRQRILKQIESFLVVFLARLCDDQDLDQEENIPDVAFIVTLYGSYGIGLMERGSDLDCAIICSSISVSTSQDLLPCIPTPTKSMCAETIRRTLGALDNLAADLQTKTWECSWNCWAKIGNCSSKNPGLHPSWDLIIYDDRWFAHSRIRCRIIEITGGTQQDADYILANKSTLKFFHVFKYTKLTSILSREASIHTWESHGVDVEHGVESMWDTFVDYTSEL